MKQKTRVLKRVLSLLLILAVLFPLNPTAVTSVSAVTQEEINSLKTNASSLAGQKKALQEQLKAIQADKNQALQKKNLLEQQINVIEAEIENLKDQIQKYEELIAGKEQELAETQKKEQTQYQLFCERIRLMEEDGQTSYWSILFSSTDFSDLLDNFMMIEEIIEYDNGIMENLLALQKQIETEKAELEQDKTDLESAKQDQESAQKELESQESEVDKLIQEIAGKEDEASEAIKKLEADAAAMDAQIKRKEKELAAQIANVPSESGFLWPLTNYNTISSLFGNRIHPITGKANHHTGIDIPAPKGTPILAAKSGVVVTSAYHGSYGNYVVVSHSDGTSTLYGHMSRRNVSEGQTVKQGAVLGYVGTTGSSTGNHLHFEIRVNGARVDPVNSYKDKTLYVTYLGHTVKLEH
ncbi:MAG: peptidoglycan DD-metalloendopeptidase family protein [Lawsonibacter sp.]|nr:peptidoglycan DD-metalloendopeptidase family protein [Lawsonibacter sp.]